MSARTTYLDVRQTSVLLRGEPALLRQWSQEWNAGRLGLCFGVIFAGAGLYGAAMGWWRSPLKGFLWRSNWMPAPDSFCCWPLSLRD